MKYIVYSFLLICALGLISCENKPSTGLVGEIEDATNMTVYFDAVDPIENVNNIVAKSETDGSGAFSIEMLGGFDPGIYRLRVGAKSAYLLFNGGEELVTVNGNLEGLSTFDYTVEGAPATQEYLSQMKAYRDQEIDIRDMQKYVRNTDNAWAGTMIGAQLFGSHVEFHELHKIMADKLAAQYPNHNLTKKFTGFAANTRKEFLRKQATEKVQIGEQAPEIAMNGPDGKQYKLSDLKGKVVLLDFWASWCGPCRKENPNVVRVYNKYKDQGFTVFSVSLDGLEERRRQGVPDEKLNAFLEGQKRRWVNAIKKDRLTWDTHVSDLKKWDNAAAALYGVRSIPRTFLLDREGKIAYVNPRRNLEEAVKDLL